MERLLVAFCDVVSGQFLYCSFLLIIICGNAAWCIVTGIVWKPASAAGKGKTNPVGYLVWILHG